jgi:aurora kinase A
VLTGYAPFHDGDYDITYRKIMKVDYKLPEFVTKAPAHFIAKLLVLNPDQRMPLDKLETHPWLAMN